MMILPFKSADFSDHAAQMGDFERELYLSLLRVYYGTERPICVDPADSYGLGRLCMTMGFDAAERRTLRRILAERFISLPANQFHPRLEQSLPRAANPWPHALPIICRQLDAQALERAK